MRNSVAFQTYSAGQKHVARVVDPRQFRGEPPVSGRPRWLNGLARVLRWGKRRTIAPNLPAPSVTPKAAPEPAIDLAAVSAFDRLYELAPRLRRAWSAGTSTLPNLWTPQHAALGQSAATACVVQDELGGDIIETKVVMANGLAISHFANVVDGLVIDFAQTEIEHTTSVPGPADEDRGFPSMRAYVLAQPGTAGGYAALRSRLAEIAGAAR